MKLATSTNIMDFDDKRPYQIPIDVSTRACAKAGYKYVDACLCSHCREGQPLRGENWEKWIADTAALAEELGVKYIQAHAYWTIGNAFNADPFGRRAGRGAYATQCPGSRSIGSKVDGSSSLHCKT